MADYRWTSGANKGCPTTRLCRLCVRRDPMRLPLEQGLLQPAPDRKTCLLSATLNRSPLSPPLRHAHQPKLTPISVLTYPVEQLKPIQTVRPCCERSTMKAAKRRKLENRGYRVTNTRAFSGLSDIEAQLIGLKVPLVALLKQARKVSKTTQTELARRLHSSQSQIAKIEARSPAISLDSSAAPLCCRRI